MKKLEATFPPFLLNEVREALRGVELAEFLVIASNEVLAAPGPQQVHRSVGLEVDFQPVLRVEIVISEDDAVPVHDAIARALNNAHGRESRIVVTDVCRAIDLDDDVSGMNRKSSPTNERRLQLELSALSALS